MLSVPDLVRIYVSMQPTDMRKGFDSLAAVVRDWLGGEDVYKRQRHRGGQRHRRG